jgi:hypothetical protein
MSRAVRGRRKYRMESSEKDMERKLEGAMEQLTILNLDYGRECADKKTLVTEAISQIKEKVAGSDKEECERILKGVRIYILGKSMNMKEIGKGKIHTVPILILCGCKSAKERLEGMVRKAGLVASFQWPKEYMEFVAKICENRRS